MFGGIFRWRKMAAAGLSLALAACTIVPKDTPPPPPPTTSQPRADVLPTDTERHRVAMLVPLSGPNAAVGQAIANAATMALLDTNAQNLRVTNYDTATNPTQAAQRAIRDGNKLILGPLLSSDIPAVLTQAQAAQVPLISFSNDETAASNNVYIMGYLPSQSVTRTVEFAIGRGIKSFGALVPRGEYGQRASDALMAAARAGGGSVQAMEAFDRSTSSITAAASRLNQRGGYGAVLIADGGRMSAVAAPLVKPTGATTQVIGTELWSGEKAISDTPALSGAWYSAVGDTRFGQFSRSYKQRFGATPYRIATLGYDAVLLTLRIAREWKPGTALPNRLLTDRGGFIGVDGAFRFSTNGVIERALEVREVRTTGAVTISAAPSRFED